MQETAEQYRQRMFVLGEGKNPVKLQSAAPSSAREALEGHVTNQSPEAPGSRKMVHCRDRRVHSGYRGGLRLADSQDCGRAGHANRWH